MNPFIAHKKEISVVAIVFCLFLLLRLPGVSLPYHQDEYKTATSVEAGSKASASMFAHPPLTQIIYRTSFFVLGGDHLRLYPIFFSSLSFPLLYILLRKKEGQKTALIGVLLFTLCFYSVWSSLMLDTDGAILPFFFLLSIFLYDKFCATPISRKKYIWCGFLIISLILGFLVKLSFILVVATLFSDFLWQFRNKINLKVIVYGVATLCGFFGLSFCFLIFIQKLYPVFDPMRMIDHARSFIHISDRNYLQVIIQAIKAVFYLSPLCVLLPFLISKQVFTKTRLYFFYLTYGFVFYFILFDFSRGALDKYLMFTVVPLVLIGAVFLGDMFQEENVEIFFRKNKKSFVFAVVASLSLFVLNFLPQTLVPLYPKTAWFGNVTHGHWLFLNPLNGGSGPLGFYISFVFIAFSFIVSILCVIVFFLKKEFRVTCVIILITTSFLYNLIFTEELLFGHINGSSSIVLHGALGYIESVQKVKSVITYNDIGSYELIHMGKHAARFYAAPMFEDAHKKLFEAHHGHFLVVDIPHIGNDNFYGAFFAKCDTVYLSTSGQITAHVYQCQK